MGALSDATAGRTSTSDPIVIPVGEGATKDPDMATEIKGRYETEGTTNPSAEEKLTINNGTHVADTKVELTPENQEKLDQIKAEIEKDKQEAIREAVLDSIGSFMLRTFLSGGVSFSTMINMALNNSLSNKIDKIENSMGHRELNVERAGVDCGYKSEYEGQTSDALKEQAQEFKNDINTLNQFEKDFSKFEHLSLPNTNETLIERVSSICDPESRDEVYEHRNEIIDGLKADLESAKQELKDFNKDHKGDNSAETKAERTEISDRMREIGQGIKQMEGFEKAYDSLIAKLDMSQISDIKGCDGFSSPQELLEHKDDIIRDIRQEINHLSHGEFVLRAEEKYGEMSKSELQEEYASHKEKAESLEHFRNADPGRFDENMSEALKYHKQEMREIECVDRINTFESDDPHERSDFERIDWEPEESKHSESIFDAFGSNNNSLNNDFNNGL